MTATRIEMQAPDGSTAAIVLGAPWQHHWQDEHLRISSRQVARLESRLAAGWRLVRPSQLDRLSLYVSDDRGRCPHCVGERYRTRDEEAE